MTRHSVITLRHHPSTALSTAPPQRPERGRDRDMLWLIKLGVEKGGVSEPELEYGILSSLEFSLRK